MTMPTATRQQQLRRDFVEQRLVAFADQLVIFVGMIRAKRESSLDGTALTTELGHIGDSAVDLLAHLTRQDTSKQRTPAQPTAARSRAVAGDQSMPLGNVIGSPSLKNELISRWENQEANRWGKKTSRVAGVVVEANPPTRWPETRVFRHGAFSLIPISNFVLKKRSARRSPHSIEVPRIVVGGGPH